MQPDLFCDVLEPGTRVLYTGRFGRGTPEEAVILGYDWESDTLVYLLDLRDGAPRWGYSWQVEVASGWSEE